MRFTASNIGVPLNAMLPGKRKALRRAVARAIGVDAAAIHDMRISRKSVDARKKNDVRFVISCTFKLVGNGAQTASPQGSVSPKAPDGNAEAVAPAWPYRTAKGVRVEPYTPPAAPAIPDLSALSGSASPVESGPAHMRPRPVVVGAGPAGLFCALWLARAGLQPLVVERGQAVEDRAVTVAAFDAGASLDPNSNIQFGEGGAGAFSDGKLTCGKTDPHIRHVLEEFVEAGAPDDILVDAKPHIGTDFLPQTVRGLREAILAAGGEILFNTQAVGLLMGGDDGAGHAGQQAGGNAPRSDVDACGENPEEEGASACTRYVRGVVLRDLSTGDEWEQAADAVVLAIGHSARDTFEVLRDAGIAMQRKPFAVGVRIEHPQQMIDRAQYGRAAGHAALPPAEYKLNVRTAEGRGVYTFCMCPGGTVVAAASESGGVCTNGMSDHARSGVNANSALLVEVHPEDLAGDDVLEGVRFQRQLERAAYDLAQQAAPPSGALPFAAPAQTVGSFLQDHSEQSFRETVQPTYPRGTVQTDLRACLPAFVMDALADALPKLDRKLHGFADPGAMMTAPEARSSSPVRIVRDRQSLEAQSLGGLFPAGEGAGYAGGIMSAATDGIRVAEAIMRKVALRAVVADAEETARHLTQHASAAVVPTDTVAGLAVAVRACPSPEVLFQMKGRDGGKPVCWLVDERAALREYGREIPDYACALADRFWPGPLTLVVKASDQVPPAYAAQDGTIGLRMPAHDAVLSVIGRTGPLATTSANISGKPAPAEVAGVDADLLLATGCALVPSTDATDAGSVAGGASVTDGIGTASGVSSTVVDCTGSSPRILREGAVSTEEVLSALQ